jgi:hypothetical protein
MWVPGGSWLDEHGGYFRVTLLPDTSAILEFARQSIHVGEVIAEVEDDKALVGLPLACLVEAAQSAVDVDRLDLSFRSTTDGHAFWALPAPLSVRSGSCSSDHPRSLPV